MPRYKRNPPPGSKSSSPSSARSEPECELVLCEDPQTGEILVKPRGKCPDGYIEKYRDKAQESGITFIIPKVKTREE